MLTSSELYIALKSTLINFEESKEKIDPEGYTDRAIYMHGEGAYNKYFFISAPCNDADVGSEDFKKAGNLDVIKALKEMTDNPVLDAHLKGMDGVDIIIPLAECRTYGFTRSHYVFIYRASCKKIFFLPKKLLC